MGGRAASELLGLPVRVHGIQLGRPAELYVDLPSRRAVGFYVVCGDDVHRFLPVAAVAFRDDELCVTSALTLLDEAQLAFYRDRATALSTLVGSELEHDGVRVGRLQDLVVAAGGAIVAIVVDTGAGVRELEPDDGLRPVVASAA